MKRICVSSFAVLVFILIFSSAPVFALTSVDNVRHWTAPDNTRIVIDTARQPDFSVQEETDTLIIDIADSQVASGLSLEYVLDVPAVGTVRVVPLPGDTTRVEVGLSKGVTTNVFKLGEILDKPHRIVIDVRIPEVEQRETKKRERVAEKERKRIIVLDPGHGGEDPGAIGPRGTREKDVVLRIAQDLRKLLVERGYQVFLTRDGDYYVSLMQRGKIARQYNADLFISIHADAAPVRSARGSSVYCISSIAASNEASRLLAASQNLSDILGGDPGNGSSDEVDPIVLNMLQTETLNQSRSFGRITLKKLDRVNDLKFRTVQGAPFRVLKLPDVTSVLVETAYLSNPQEELLLRNDVFRADIAWALAAAVTEYLPNQYAGDFRERDARYQPRSRSMVMARQESTYTVRPGDRLERIASNHGTTVRELMALNNIRSRDRIFIGQTLTIPGDYGPLDTVDAIPAVYTVESGDTLERVARRYGVSMADLAQVNSIQSRDRIYVGQTLYLSEPPSQATASAAPTTHVVQRGDTLEQIAHRYGVPMAELARLNNIRSRDRILVGQRLVLSDRPASRTPASTPTPVAPTTHVVQRGDTLQQIANRYGISMAELDRLNNLRSRDRILVGQRLVVSGSTSASTSSSSGSPVSPPPATYVVSRGDTLEQISRRHGVSMADLARFNDISSRDRIYVGQQLDLTDNGSLSASSSRDQTPRTHVVSQGETLERIASQYAVSMAELARLNNLRSRDHIYVGQRLTLSGSQPASASLTSSVSSTPTVHVVARGESLVRIAHRYGVTVDDIVRANNLQSVHRIHVGQRLTIPSTETAEVYTVARGDTLETIASRFGTTVDSLMSANSLESRHRILVGQQITIYP